MSLSPHVAVLTSPDLDELLKSSSLPSLPHILQSFSPLPQVTTRTTTLVSVPHTSFALSFSDLHEIEEACREGDDRRAERTIDWITARISHRCAKWVQDIEKTADKDTTRTPWWDELRRCVEGDFVPSKTEGWNHPVAVILAASTTTPNPLQAITALHSRNNQLPPWVDSNFLRYTLIIHPKDSVLSDEEATALYNAVKKQFGLHSYLLPLALPKLSPPPVPVPALLPRLPPPPPSEGTPVKSPLTPNVPAGPSALNTLRMAEGDIQQTARFTREFVVMSLVPWMEKCVLEWNENFSSTRRLPSRLFSSTRRLFGSPSPSPSPTPTAMIQHRSSTLPAAVDGPVPPSQTRRLAEFSTILGDVKLAISVWEALRRDSKGGSDILPLFLSPSSSMKHHAQAALMTINVNLMDLSPHAQIRALTSAVRWEAGISSRDFLDNEVEGERWLVWAASNAEEAPSALLLAQSALLSTRKQAWRKAALWYALAATRLEKCGIKPLTMYFLRKVQELYANRPQKELSPSFWDSEGKSPTNNEGLESIMAGIEHRLGRLLYTAGDIASAVKLFLSLLRGASGFPDAMHNVGDDALKVSHSDRLYLDDFRVAFSYLKSTEPDRIITGNLELPSKFCVSKLSRPRYPGDTDNHTSIWSNRQELWESYWKSTGGKETVAPAGKFTTNELFWIDLTLQNPLDADVSLTNLSLVVQETTTKGLSSTADFVEVETIKEVLLHAKESLVVPISLMSTRPAKLSITHASYEFLSLLEIKESLSCRGRRLHDTPLQRQAPTYAPDVLMQVEVVPSDHKLTVDFVFDEQLVLLQGEIRSLKLWLTNSGTNPISEVWMVSGIEDEVWVGPEDVFLDSTTETEVVRSSNLLKPSKPFRLPLAGANDSHVLQPGENAEVAILLHSEDPGDHRLCLLFTFREDPAQSFLSTRLTKSYHVLSLFNTSVNATPSSSQGYAYVIEVDVSSTTLMTEADITDIISLSPQWRCHALSEIESSPSGSYRFLLGASPWPEGQASQDVYDCVIHNMTKFLKGTEVDLSLPSPIDLLCSHILKKSRKSSTESAAIKSFIHGARWKYLSRFVSQQYSSIPSALHPCLFPLYNPATLDFLIFWEIPSQNRFGHTNLHGVTLGAAHGVLDNLIEGVENVKATKGMFAETRRENMQVSEAIRKSEWNLEMNPVVLSVRDSTVKTHDFSTGPCYLPAEFMLRNHSLRLPARYILKLQSETTPPPGLLPPSYTGRLTFRGEIAPSQTATVQARLWVTRPGTYSLTGWSVETEITPTSLDGSSRSTCRRRYVQQPPVDDSASVVVCDSRTL